MVKVLLFIKGCTIGHKRNGAGSGVFINDNVKVYCNSSIIGEVEIGENVIIGAHVLITKNVIPNSIVTNALEINSKLINTNSF